MINIKPTVVAALKGDATLTGLLGGQRIYFKASPKADEYPRITYYILGDTESGHTHDQGATTEKKGVVIDIWHTGSTSAIEQRVDTVMKSLNPATYVVKRENKIDLSEDDTKVNQAHMTYEIQMISQ